MKEILEEAVIKGNLETLYNLVSALRAEDDRLEEAYEQARYGMLIPFDINRLIEGHCITKRKQGIIIINNNVYTLEDYWTEKELRTQTLRLALIQHLREEEEPIAPRGIYA